MFTKGMSLEAKKALVLSTVKARKDRCEDEYIKAGRLKYKTLTDGADMCAEGFLKLAVSDTPITEPMIQQLKVSSHACGQLLGRMKIPASYWNRCPSHLKATNVNYWLQVYAEKQLLLRYLDHTVRAIFSSRFSTDLDDHILYPVVLEALEEAYNKNYDGELHLKSFHQDPDFSLLRAFYKSHKAQHQGHMYFAGVSISNSEVGRSSIWIKPVIRAGNEYGAYDYIDRCKEGALAIRHIGDLCTEEIKLAIIQAREVAEVGIYQLMRAGKEIVENPVQEIKQLVEDSDFLNMRLFDIMEEQYQDKVQATKLELARSMLEAIKELPLFRRHLAEGEIGRYLDLFRDTKNRLTAIMEDQAAMAIQPTTE